MKGIYHLQPIYKSFVWGGRKLIEEFKLDSSLENIGTIYAVIAIPGHLDNLVLETGTSLSEFFRQYPEVFGCSKTEFPVRLSITCNEGFQSYQLHPTDSYAMQNEKTWGKVSGSVALQESSHVSEKLFGNKASSQEEFKRLVETGDWENLFQKVKVKDGDFLHTPAGVIHGGYGDGHTYAAFGTNGDITYRFYDLGREDPDRPLQLKQVYDCVTVPEQNLSRCVIHPIPRKVNNVEILDYYTGHGEYTAKQLRIDGCGIFGMEEFYCVTNIEGEGSVDGEILKKGETLLIEQKHGSVEMAGKMRLMLLSYCD